MKHIYTTSVILLFFISVLNSHSQSSDSIKTYSIREVKVLGKSKPSTVKSSSPLQVLTTTEIERVGIVSISDAVRRLAGVSVKDYGGLGGMKSVSVRGLGDQNTAVLYDGVASSNSQSGSIDIGRFDLENISMITLSVGQPQNIFQTAKAFASASVLSITTKKPDFSNKNIIGRASIKSGAWGLFNPSLFLGSKMSQKWYTTIDVNWLRSDGNYPFKFNNGAYIEKRKRNNSDINTWRSELNIYGDLNKGGKIQFKTSYYDSSQGLPGSVISVNTVALDRIKNRDFFSQLNYENDFSEKFSLKGYAKYSRLYSQYKNFINYNSTEVDKYTQNEYYISAVGLYKLTDYLSTSLAQDYAYNNLTANYQIQQHPSRNTSLTALNFNFTTKPLDVTATLLGTYIGEQVKSGSKPKDKKRLSPALSILYNPFDNGLRFRASYKDIYRIPTFNDMYYYRMGNIKLRPEISRQYNVGVTFAKSFNSTFSAFTISVDGYINKVKDKIVIFAAAPLSLSLTNLDNVTIRGLDISTSSEFTINKDLSLLLSGNYTYQSSKNDETHLQTPYTPEHSGAGSVSLDNKWVNVSYSIVASGKRYSKLNQTSLSRMDPYFDHTISINKTFLLGATSLRLQAELLNLSNKNYEIISGYPMPGRSFRISSILKF